jgi:sterol desaturase/sphingolipid hydroxylase (fatty acid hydroxylase superfamily)
VLSQAKSWTTDLLGAEGARLLGSLYWALAPVFDEPTFHWVFVVSAVLLALAVFATAPEASRRSGLRGFIAYLLPKEIYLHPSATLDYRFYVVNQLAIVHLRLGLFVTSLVGVLAVGDLSRIALTAAFGPPAVPLVAPGPVAVVAFTVCMALAYDFAKFLAHYLSHKLPLLWEFHKVHHSVEVMTPISNFRAHPVDILFDRFLRLLLTGAVVGAFSYRFADRIEELTLLNFSLLSFVFYLTNLLRHSHVRLGFGPYLSYVLSSPFMHQLHHSSEGRHFDKNFGQMFSFWDYLAGCLYIPRRDEQFRLGLPAGSGRFDSLWALYAGPFIRIVRRASAPLTRSRSSAG